MPMLHKHKSFKKALKYQKYSKNSKNIKLSKKTKKYMKKIYKNMIGGDCKKNMDKRIQKEISLLDASGNYNKVDFINDSSKCELNFIRSENKAKINIQITDEYPNKSPIIIINGRDINKLLDGPVCHSGFKRLN